MTTNDAVFLLFLGAVNALIIVLYIRHLRQHYDQEAQRPAQHPGAEPDLPWPRIDDAPKEQP